MEIKEKIKEIYSAHKKSGLYNDSLENVIYRFTNAYDYLFLAPMKQSMLEIRKGSHNYDRFGDIDYDIFRMAYRACLKFAYEDCQKGNVDFKLAKRNLIDYIEELRDTINFNYIRNTIDRYNLGDYDVTINNQVLEFTNKQKERSLVYDYYSRIFSDRMPGGKDDKDIYGLQYLYSIIFHRVVESHTFKSKKNFLPHKDEIESIIRQVKPYFLKSQGEGILDFAFEDYSIRELILVYCFLAVIGICKTAHLLSTIKSEEELQSSIIYPKGRLISDIEENTAIEKDKIVKILKLLTYDYEFHKDKLTIYQPLFDFGEYILYSPNMIFHSDIIPKICKYYDNKKINAAVSTRYHKYLSDQMNNRMYKRIQSSYPKLKVFKNLCLKEGTKSKAEIDLLLIDPEHKTGILAELKKYNFVDNETEVKNRDILINEKIEDRIIHDQAVLSNLRVFFVQNNISEEYLDYEYHSLFIVDSYAGGVRVKEKIKLLDCDLFYYLMNDYEGNLKKVIDDANTSLFFKQIKEEMIKQGYEDSKEFNYKGIRVIQTSKI